MKKYIIVFGLLYGCIAQAQFDYPPAPPALTNITAAEYFIDADPGFGAATPITITAANNIPALLASIDLTGLTPGVHQLRVRSRDANGYWSITASQIFENLQPLYNNASNLANITAAEYFIDADPGFGLATSIPLTPSVNINSLLVSIDLTGTGTPGNKLLFIRSSDANGKWSLTNNVQFNNAMYIYPPAPVAPGNVMVMEYFFDADPGFGNGTPVTFTSSPDLNNFLFSADISTLPAGTHTLFIRSKQNPWSLVAASEFLKSSTLPVTLLSFSGSLSGNDVLLKWITSSEQNSSHFIVERSVDGGSYTTIGNVTAAGNSSVQQQYNYTDADIATGIVYYRLKQVDIDGQYKYSPVIRIRLVGGPDVVIAPNPVTSQLQLNSLQTGTVIRIVDAAGRLVYNGQWNGTAIPVSHWAKGMYTLQVQAEGSMINRKFIKQ
jgi:Secretion system C-terminal sorting domain